MPFGRTRPHRPALAAAAAAIPAIASVFTCSAHAQTTAGFVDPVTGVVFHDVAPSSSHQPASADRFARRAEQQPSLDLYSGAVYRSDQLAFADAPGHDTFDSADFSYDFARRGYTALTTGVGIAFTEASTDYQGYLTYAYFPADEFELSWTLSGWFFDQEEDTEDGGDPTAGLNFSFGARLYFLDLERPTRDQWAWYLEAGIGVLVSGQDVPEDGSEFNFTPRAGGGVSIPVNIIREGTRLDVGLRWHHISNASQFGTDNNPDRDSVMVYTGLTFPL